MRWPNSEFSDRLAYAGGLNQYGEPIFKFAWGQTDTFRASDGTQYREFLTGGGDPCWMLLMWEPAEIYGSPDLFYLENAEDGGMCILGEYPYHGRYRLIHKFVARYLVGNRLVTDALELESWLIDAMLPLVKIWQGLRAADKIFALAEDQRMRNQEACSAFEGKKSDYRPREGSLEVKRKAEVLEKNWARLMKIGSVMKRTGRI